MTTTTTPMIPVREDHAERPSAVSRWSFRASLLAFLFAAAYIVALVFFLVTKLQPPAWAFAAQVLVPPIDLVLGATGAALNLWEMLRILKRAQAFEPGEAGRGFALDDLGEILSRVRQGCFARVSIPLALVGSMAALLLSLVPLPGFDDVQVNPGFTLQSCVTTGALAPFTFELDNSASTIDVSWSAAPVETVSGGALWAQVQPSEGKLQPGQRSQVQVIPNLLVCQSTAQARRLGGLASAAAVRPGATAKYHVKVTIDGRTHRTSTVDMSLTSAPPVPGQLQVSPTQGAPVDCTGSVITYPPITLSNVGGQPLHWSASATATLGDTTISPSSGTLAPGQSQTLSVSQVGPTSAAASISIVPDGGQAQLITFSCAAIPTPTPSPTPTPRPTATPTPTPNLHVTQNQGASQSCNSSTALKPYTITLSNAGGNVPVSWQYVAVEQVPNTANTTVPWASANPASATLAAGQTQSVTVTPQTSTYPGYTYCPAPTTLHASLNLSFPQGGSQGNIALTDNVTALAPPPTPTPPPPPNIAGTYCGTFTPGSQSIDLYLSQSGATLSGTTVEGSTVYNDTGTISSNGSFTITETFSGVVVAYLRGSLVGPGHLAGTWDNGGPTQGTWDVQTSACIG